MPARALQREAAALLGYVSVAVAFAWPLPLHLEDRLLGIHGGDTGVYLWNLWVFRHEIVSHHQLPFLTSEILALSQPVPLALHNYTAFADLLALPVLPILGLVRTFNLLIMVGGVATAYAMFWYGRRRTGDAAAAWIGGLLFGFSPFMSARAVEHFSLVLAAPLPVFGWLMYRLNAQPTRRLACAAGATVAWAYLCDPYFAVYCLLIAFYMAGYSIFRIERQSVGVRRRVWPRAVVELLLVSVAGLVADIVLTGGWNTQVLGVRVSSTRLYTPVLALTVLMLMRLGLTLRFRLVEGVLIWPYLRAAVLAAFVCAVILAPAVLAGLPIGERQWISPTTLWRSSAPGVDLLAFFAPNPLHPWFGSVARSWLTTLPNQFAENVASVPWVAIGTMVVASLVAGFRVNCRWTVFTVLFAGCALGPFVRVAGHLSYVPTPWALLRYVPIVGAARMPARMTVLVMLGVSILLVMALQHLRARSRRPTLLTATIGGLLLFELLPAPRALYSADIPSVYRIVAADPRPVRLLTLPSGLRDGMSSRGDFLASAQFYQTVHGKRLVGGYLSRLPGRSIDTYDRVDLLRVLFRLSEQRSVEPALLEAALEQADDMMARLEIGYVLVDTGRASGALADFARRAFRLTPVSREGPLELYHTRLAPPIGR
jgi:hypothetical protein